MYLEISKDLHKRKSSRLILKKQRITSFWKSIHGVKKCKITLAKMNVDCDKSYWIIDNPLMNDNKHLDTISDMKIDQPSVYIDNAVDLFNVGVKNSPPDPIHYEDTLITQDQDHCGNREHSPIPCTAGAVKNSNDEAYIPQRLEGYIKSSPEPTTSEAMLDSDVNTYVHQLCGVKEQLNIIGEVIYPNVDVVNPLRQAFVTIPYFSDYPPQDEPLDLSLNKKEIIPNAVNPEKEMENVWHSDLNIKQEPDNIVIYV